MVIRKPFSEDVAIRPPEIVGGWFTIDGIVVKNSLTTEGIEYLKNAAVRGSVSPISQWYCGVISNHEFVGAFPSDTMSEHGGWLEATDYSEGDRQQWSPDSPTAGQITNGTAMVVSWTSDVVINGLFIVSNSTKGGTSGTLLATAILNSPLSRSSGQTSNLTYTL